ncbi:MAG: Holliday junction branch migration protein RuvA [Maioricimonas sp. JB045]
MITRITGTLVDLSGTEATLAVGAFEYEVFVPDFVRRQLQSQIDREVSLITIEFLDGNVQKGGRLTPRLIGFLHKAERDFFDMICQVDGVGVKKALQAMVRPVHEVAEAIEEQDVKLLSTLPGIGPAVAERIIAKLRRKMAKFALLIERDLPPEGKTAKDVLNEGYEALLALGHTPAEAHQKIEPAAQSKGKFKNVEELIHQIYMQQRPQ